MPTDSPPSLETLVAAHVDLVYSAALRQVRDPHLADDVTQAVFVVLARKLERLPPAELLGPWLLKVTRYTALTARRAVRRRDHHEHAALRGELVEPAFPGEDDRLLALLDEALMALPDPDRRAVTLRFLESRPLPEVAAALRLRNNTAAKRIERALEKMRRYLSRRGAAATTSSLAAALSLTLKPAPVTLAARILSAAPAALPVPPALPLGVYLMPVKMKFAAVAAAVAVAAGVCFALLHRRAEAEPLTIVASRPASMPAAAAPQAVTLSGTVTDAAGKPLGNVLVTQGYSRSLAQGYVKTQTDAGGHFEMRNVRAGGQLFLAAQGPGFAPALITGVVTGEAKPFSLVLEPAKTLRLRMVDSHGKPIANMSLDPMNWRNSEVLRIYDFAKPGPGEERGKWSGPLSDAEGHVVWKAAPEDAVTFSAFTFDPVEKAFLRKYFTVTATDAEQTIVVPFATQVTLTLTDADTHKPMPNFQVISGWGEDDKHAVVWNEERPFSGIEGKATFTLTWAEPVHFLRIVAPGYAPLVKTFTEAEADADGVLPLAASVSKHSGVKLAILAPGNVPAAHVPVTVVPSEQSYSLNVSQIFKDPRMPPTPAANFDTDSEGTVQVADPNDAAARVVVIAPEGFANVSFAEAAKGPVHLDAWASVEGVVYTDGQLAPHQQVALNYGPGEGKPYISGILITTTDADGHFAFKTAPPGRVSIGRRIETNFGLSFGSGTTSGGMGLTLAPGKAASVTIGATGRAVVGKITQPDGLALEAGLVCGMISVNGLAGEGPAAAPPLPESAKFIGELPAAQRAAAYQLWAKSPDGIAYAAAHKAWLERHRFYAAAVAPDGSFRVDDLDPGVYTLSVPVYRAATSSLAASVSMPLTVRPFAGQRNLNPLELGNVPIKPAP